MTVLPLYYSMGNCIWSGTPKQHNRLWSYDCAVVIASLVLGSNPTAGIRLSREVARKGKSLISLMFVALENYY